MHLTHPVPNRMGQLERRVLQIVEVAHADIPLNLTLQLIAGDRSKETISAIEQATDAYFPLEGYFGGIQYHPDGTGFERPLYRPQSPDANPLVQAIATIGRENAWWHLLKNNFSAASIRLDMMDSMHMLVLHPQPNSATVSVDTYPSVSGSVQNRTSSDHPYPRRLRMITCGGSVDFYDVGKNLILPIYIHAEQVNGVSIPDARVQGHELGLNRVMTEPLWWARMQYSEALSKAFHMAVLETHDHVHLPTGDKTLISQMLATATIISADFDIILMLIDLGHSERILPILRAVRHQLHQMLLRAGTQSELYTHITTLAEHLQQMYDTARTFRKDIYPY